MYLVIINRFKDGWVLGHPASVLVPYSTWDSPDASYSYEDARAWAICWMQTYALTERPVSIDVVAEEHVDTFFGTYDRVRFTITFDA